MAFLLLALAALMIVGSVVWLFGPFGLLGAGLALGAWALFGVEVEERRGEPVDPAA